MSYNFRPRKNTPIKASDSSSSDASSDWEEEYVEERKNRSSESVKKTKQKLQKKLNVEFPVQKEDTEEFSWSSLCLKACDDTNMGNGVFAKKKHSGRNLLSYYRANMWSTTYSLLPFLWIG